MKKYTIKRDVQLTAAEILAIKAAAKADFAKPKRAKPTRRQVLEKQAKKNGVSFEANISNTQLHFLINHAPKIAEIEKTNDALAAAGAVLVKKAGARKTFGLVLLVGKILNGQTVHTNLVSGRGRNTKIIRYDEQIEQIFQAAGISVIFGNNSPTGYAKHGVTCKLA